MKKLITIIIIFLLFPIISNATIYKYKDKEGVIHFTDDLTNIPPEYQDQLNTTTKTITESGYIEEKKTPNTYEKKFYKNTPQGPRNTVGCFEEVTKGNPVNLPSMCQ